MSLLTQLPINSHSYIHRFTCPLSNSCPFIYDVIDQPRNHLSQFSRVAASTDKLSGVGGYYPFVILSAVSTIKWRIKITITFRET
jgi:hypothetical protein